MGSQWLFHNSRALSLPIPTIRPGAAHTARHGCRGSAGRLRHCYWAIGIPTYSLPDRKHGRNYYQWNCGYYRKTQASWIRSNAHGQSPDCNRPGRKQSQSVNLIRRVSESAPGLLQMSSQWVPAPAKMLLELAQKSSALDLIRSHL